MAKSTADSLTQLHDQIETIRKDAYQEGYAAAMQAILAFTKPHAPAAAKEKAKAPTKPAAKPAAKSVAKPAVQTRTRRPGGNVIPVVEALKGLPDQTGRGSDIRNALIAKGITLAFTSIRHALNQLQARGAVTLDADGKTWHAISA